MISSSPTSPRFEFPEDKEEMEKALDAKSDLSFKVALEVLPKFDLADISDITVSKPVAEVGDKEIAETLERMAGQNRSFESEGRPRCGRAATAWVVDFTSAPWMARLSRGGRAQDISVDLGSNTFIPGFRGSAPRREGG